MPRKKTTEEFIAESRAVHGDKYDYSKVEYVNNNTKVTIVCPDHGDFYILPRTHVSSKIGCTKCTNRYMDLDYFKEKAISIHGDVYDYSKVNYVNAKTKIDIVCKQHGVFSQTPNTHINGSGCPECGNIKSGLSTRRLVFGFGVNDYTGTITESETVKNCYDIWCQMLRRVYTKDERHRSSHKTYSDVVVCEEWRSFTSFMNWMLDSNNGYKKGLYLDKDLMVKGSKIYSPNTCCFLNSHLNSVLTKSDSSRGDQAIGVGIIGRNRNKFGAKISKYDKTIHLGCFGSEIEAFNAYKSEKENHLKELADVYYAKGDITERVRDALYNYIVELDD